MRITRVHFPGSLSGGQLVKLPPESAHHVATVLRMKPDDRVSLFNQRDGEYLARIVTVKKSDVELSVEEQIASYQEPGLQITLCLGISRGDRMDFGIQKSVELGVFEIRPFYSEHGDIRIKPQERVEKKLRHWQKIAISAAEQCGRLDVPVIAAPVEFTASLEACTDSSVLLDPRGDSDLSQLEGSGNIHLFIGPEGGFSEGELQSARKQGCVISTLGPRILRTETAPIAALAILQNRFGDM
jgi:16S rRNA (uracil1498-N3)-methyltransferase